MRFYHHIPVISALLLPIAINFLDNSGFRMPKVNDCVFVSGDRKENEDPNIRTTVIKNGGSSKRERATRKQEEKLTLSPLKSANPNYVNNGTTLTVANAKDSQDSTKLDKALVRIYGEQSLNLKLNS